MDALVIAKRGADWYAGISNTKVMFKFAGDAERQEASMRAMAHCMTEGNTTGWDVFFDGVDNDELATELLGSSTEIYVGSTEVFSAAAGETALTEIGEAGKLLWEALEAIAE